MSINTDRTPCFRVLYGTKRVKKFISLQYAPDSVWFGYQKMPAGVRDLGDLVIWICKIQITIWYKGAYYVKS